MTDPATNLTEYSVTEIASAVKRTIEDGFGLVRIRGELGRVTRAASGHMYMDLKDDKASLSGVIWKGNAGRLKIAPEQGMEVVATGRLTTFPGQSRYQLIIDSIEPAGAGALMALFEKRKAMLADEGLFAEDRKKPLPFLPEIIGVVTSPSGAVIRDILHRLRDRFPRHVIVWPTVVQGRGAEEKIAAAITGFNALGGSGSVPRPDVLIVARGGGSLEDLWCFNEEVVARAAAQSDIPLISAVGHETDTTLIDFVSDRRAPTPTAAAEMAVPVRTELMGEVLNKARRMMSAQTRLHETARSGVLAAGRGLGRPEDILGTATQRLDRSSDRLKAALEARAARASSDLAHKGSRLGAQTLAAGFARHHARIGAARDRFVRAAATHFERPAQRLVGASKLLNSLSYHGVLQRGFTLVRDEKGAVVRSSTGVLPSAEVSLVFHDGARVATINAGAHAGPRTGGQAASPSTDDRSVATTHQKSAKGSKKKTSKTGQSTQESLFD